MMGTRGSERNIANGGSGTLMSATDRFSSNKIGK